MAVECANWNMSCDAYPDDKTRCLKVAVTEGVTSQQLVLSVSAPLQVVVH